MLISTEVRQLVIEAARRFGDDPFLLDDEALGPVSYSDLLRFCFGVEKELDNLSIPQGAAVATLFHNCGLAALLFLAVIAARRLLVPLNPLSTEPELQYMLDRAECSAVIVDPTHVTTDNFGGRPTVRILDHRQYFSQKWEQHASSAQHDVSDDNHRKVVGEVVFTSGSTGYPKGVVLSESSLIANARALAGAYDLRRTDRFLTVCPLFHNSGQVFTTLGCLLAGGSTAAVKSDIGMLHFWSYIDKYRANWSFGMNSFLALLLAKADAPQDPGRIRGILTGGSAIDASVISQFESRFGVPVRTVYGLTETSSISTCEHLDPNPRSLGSSGKPLPICTVRLRPLDDSAWTPENSALVPNQRGEILISGENVFEGYIGDLKLTDQRKHNGWVYTGDVGYFDVHGNLFVIDRLDSMLIVGGENVYPAEVERLCTLLPGAAQIMLVGTDHTIWGTTLTLVYKTLNSEAVSIREWHRVLTGHLAAAKIPQRYVALEDLGLVEFPKRQNGKLDRRAVSALLKHRLPCDR